jgi:hypothetical protein
MLADDDDRLRESATALSVALVTKRKPIVTEMLNLNSSDSVSQIDVSNVGNGQLPPNFILDGFQLLVYTSERRSSLGLGGRNTADVALGKNNQFFEWLADNEVSPASACKILAAAARQRPRSRFARA